MTSSRVDADGKKSSLGTRLKLLDSEYAEASTILGFMYLDGEGTRQDNTEAVRWFKEGKAYGSEPAARALGHLFNTGQF